MVFRIFENDEELAEFASDQLVEQIKQKPDGLICLATGSSPLLTYGRFVQKVFDQRLDCSKLHFIGLDEWLGISASNSGSCKFFLIEHVFKPLGLGKDQFFLFDGVAPDSQRQCALMEAQIAKWKGIDLMVVGIGLNGHIGFNEPNADPTQHAHVANLSEMTKAVGQKYFQEHTKLTQGLTLGIADFFEARRVMMLANGRHKAAIIKQTMTGPISMEIPSTQMRKHHNALLLMDVEAAADLDED